MSSSTPAFNYGFDIVLTERETGWNDRVSDFLGYADIWLRCNGEVLEFDNLHSGHPSHPLLSQGRTASHALNEIASGLPRVQDFLIAHSTVEGIVALLASIHRLGS